MYYILLCGYTVVCIRISYNMGKRDLPDTYIYIYIYTARGPQARGRGCIYQANPDCPCYKYYIGTTKVHTTSNKSKPTITTILHLLGYKYTCVMMYSRDKM